METKIGLRYTGPAVEAGRMDVYEASANMIAFSEFAVAAAKTAFGEKVDARAQVAGFERGSFTTLLAIQIAGPIATIFANATPETVLQIVKEAIDLWKHLKGSPPTSVVHKRGNFVEVKNNNGEIIQVTTNSLTLVMSEKGSESSGKFVRDALAKPGMDALEISADGKKLQQIEQKESGYFVPVVPEKTITDTVVRLGLILEAPVFKDDLKWRFFDGQQSFFADIEDKDFLARVDAGNERFGKGDVLYADVRISQKQSGMKLTAERTIVKVYEHKQAAQQLTAL